MKKLGIADLFRRITPLNRARLELAKADEELMEATLAREWATAVEAMLQTRVKRLAREVAAREGAEE